MVIFGFGIQEDKVRKEIEEAIRKGIAEGKTVEEITKKWNDEADVYDKQPRGTAPERYTRVFFDGKQVKFKHINRDHPFSPDGWAMLELTKPLDDILTGEEYWRYGMSNFHN